jgi:hypothetical protein
LANIELTASLAKAVPVPNAIPSAIVDSKEGGLWIAIGIEAGGRGGGERRGGERRGGERRGGERRGGGGGGGGGEERFVFRDIKSCTIYILYIWCGSN